MRIAKCLLDIFIIQIILAVFSVHGYALKKPTHFVINEYIAKHEIGGFSLDEYLNDQLGFQEGIDKILEQFEGQKIDDNPPTIYRWLGYGGRAEDEPWFFRSLRHFHNPLETWDEAGLWDTFESSIIWGQRTDQWPGGHYSWQDVRDYFHLALTSEYQNIREYYFAETFRGLGQLMHLVEDASVPLHTRNDAHYFDNYEDYVERFRDKDPDIFNGWLSNSTNYGYNKSVLYLTQNPLAPIAIARIIDTDKYNRNGDNPEITVTDYVGIAEYSNANFLSHGTIPGTIADGDFPYPILGNHLFGGSCELQYFDVEDPRDPSQTVKRPYWVKVAHGATGYRLSTFPYILNPPPKIN